MSRAQESGGHARRGKAGGHNRRGKRSAEYTAWQSMKTRCGNPKVKNWARYGGRGIRICQRWRNSFLAFLEDMGPRPEGHTLGRIDNDGDYEPHNAHWESTQEQSFNKSNTLYVEWNGERRVLAELAREHGLEPGVVGKRVKKLGWTVERALLTPVKRRKPINLITHAGMNLNAAKWSALTGICLNTIRDRLKNLGWATDKALDYWKPPEPATAADPDPTPAPSRQLLLGFLKD